MIHSSCVFKNGTKKEYFSCRECNTNQGKKYRKTEKGRENTRKAVYKSINKHRDKHNARAKVYQGLKRGNLLKQNCPCGSEKSEAHHEDYSKPLEVIWLCRSCHSDEHKKLV